MIKNKRRIISSLFLCVISFIYASLALTFAWFIVNQKEDFTSSNFQIVNFNGDLFSYNGNITDKGDYRGFSILGKGGTYQTLDKTAIPGEVNSSFSLVETKDYSNAFKMSELLPDIRYCFLVGLDSLFDQTLDANFIIDKYQSSMVNNYINPITKDNLINGTTSRNIALTEAINIYIGDPLYIDKKDTTSISTTLNSIEKFINSSEGVGVDDIKDSFHGDLRDKNIYETSTTPYTLKTISINSYQRAYVPLIFEFSNNNKTYYSYDELNACYKHDILGNSNVYKSMSFVINLFTITPYI